MFPAGQMENFRSAFQHHMESLGHGNPDFIDHIDIFGYYNTIVMWPYKSCSLVILPLGREGVLHYSIFQCVIVLN